MNLLTSGTNDTLDPLTTILKLYILSFKTNGAKISICNNTVIINELGLAQGISRGLYYRSVKNDIDLLTMPVMYACEKYLLSNRKIKSTLNELIDHPEVVKETNAAKETKMETIPLSEKCNDNSEHKSKTQKKQKKSVEASEDTSKEDANNDSNKNTERVSETIEFDLSDPYQKFLYLFTVAIRGLNTLKQAYKGDKITHTIDKHSNTIKDYLKENSAISTTLNDGSGALKKLVYDSISKVWTEERLSIVFQLINQIKNDTQHQLYAVRTLEVYLNYMDLCVNDIINGLT